MAYIVKSSLDVKPTVVAWTEKEMQKLIRDKEKAMKKAGIKAEEPEVKDEVIVEPEAEVEIEEAEVEIEEAETEEVEVEAEEPKRNKRRSKVIDDE